MKTTRLTRRLPALLLALLGFQVSLAPAAGAEGGLLGLGLLAPAAQSAPVSAPLAPAAPTMLQVEQRLAALRYDVGPIDGAPDGRTTTAVMAFQKVNGLARTGVLTDPVAARIMATQAPPPPMVLNGEPNRIEVSLARQVLFLYEGGALTRILAVSTGTAATPTPTGTFRINRFDPGWHTSRLGRLYNAEYFVGGYAFHGSLSVPAQPASHGCIRLSMSAARWFPDHVTRGMQVVILPS